MGDRPPAAATLLARLGLPAGTRAVVVNADDLGMCHAATEGCLDALDRGLATSSSLLVPCPWARAAAADPRALDVGVHLTLTAEWRLYRWSPLTDGPSLRAPDGTFPTSPRRVGEQAVPAEVAAEARAQVGQALAWGVDVTHLDAHMYVMHDTTGLVDVYLDLAAELGLPVRLPGSVLDDDPRIRDVRARCAARGVVAPDHLVPLPAMGSRAPLTEALARLEPGVTEFHAHPALDTPELRAIAPDWPTRVDDHELLVRDIGFRDAMVRSGAVLIGYRALREVMRAG